MIESVAEKTYAGTTISDIVARASVSRTTFYKRFVDKRTCFDATLARCIRALQSVAGGAFDPGDPPPVALHKSAKAVLDFLASEPGLAHLVMGEAVTVEPATFGAYRDHLVPHVRALWETNGKQPKAYADPQLALGRAQVLIFNKIAAGETASLPDLLPEIVYLVVLPFGGHRMALEQAGLSGVANAESVPG
ncbi:MAG TPA: TetR/AcrR family transcriptional regulator [Solirubrobacterales bacterium]|nr:TetR/AcrR family transcriptional regulator [Solirubrobacterales bacterium]